jgi:NAD(P)-dependent dehydrogenase (short-subunit alcohol dehydrogenase family)
MELEATGCRLLRVDVTDDDSMRAAVEEIERAEGAVGALVNNAGYSLSGAVESIALEDASRACGVRAVAGSSTSARWAVV